jgi:hypothetical protein
MIILSFINSKFTLKLDTNIRGTNKMRAITYVWLIFISIFSSSCSHYTVNGEGYIRPPKGYKFSYSSKARQLISSEIIDTTSIYLMHNSNYYRHTDEYKNSDSYIRFYANGRFKLQGIKKGLQLEEVNNMNCGIVGYYKLKGKVVKLQLYSDINAGSDQLEFGLVNEDKDLVILNENPRTYFTIGYSEKGIQRKIKTAYKNPMVYKKTKIEGLTYVNPDW